MRSPVCACLYAIRARSQINETQKFYFYSCSIVVKEWKQKKMIKEKDCLFFYQLLFPFCDTHKSGIENDPRMSYYSKVELWTNAYALQLGLGGSYGHKFSNVMIQELVNFDGILIKDGVKGGSDGAIYRRWQNCEDMDQSIIDAMTYRRFLQIKRTLKLCDNRVCPKQGEDGYDPLYKLDYIWKVLVHNVNAISKKVELDLCGDETAYATGEFGEKGAGIVGRIANKTGITKGGQILLVSNVHRV